jgi:(E)-4-hydroxy-3-methylbut-2-enyl-diphosphate synthase
VADIHFDYRLALSALAAGADGLRLNPGNIRDKEHIKKVVMAAKAKDIPIRIGVNAGSLPPGKPRKLSTAEYMVETAIKQVRLLEDWDYDLTKIALKAFDVPTTVEAYRGIARKTHYPLHIGVTEGRPAADRHNQERGGDWYAALRRDRRHHQGIAEPPQEEVIGL